jgi:hypothetical protein
MKKTVLCGVLSTCFLTAASAQTTILSEDFEQGIPGSWTIVINDTNTVDSSVVEFAPGWITLPDPDNPEDTVAGATSFFEEPAEADRWLISPAFTVGAYGNFLKWEARSHDPSWQDGYYVFVSTSDTQLSSFTDTIATIGFEQSEWMEWEVNLSDKGYNNQTIHIAFVLRSYDAYKLYLDDIHVRMEDPVGIEEMAAQPNIQLYPNPATDFVVVKGDQVGNVTIYTMNGKRVLHQQIVSGQQISVAHLQPGTYIVETQTANGIARKKLVKN